MSDTRRYSMACAICTVEGGMFLITLGRPESRRLHLPVVASLIMLALVTLTMPPAKMIRADYLLGAPHGFSSAAVPDNL